MDEHMRYVPPGAVVLSSMRMSDNLYAFCECGHRSVTHDIGTRLCSLCDCASWCTIGYFPIVPTWGILMTDDGLALLDEYVVAENYGGKMQLQGQRLFITANLEDVVEFIGLTDDQVFRVESRARERSRVWEEE